MIGRLARRGACGAFAASVLALAGTLAACGTSSGADTNAQQTIRFVWWGNQDRADATNKAVALFEKQHPNIHVQTEFSGYDAYVQKLTTQIAGGASPDVVQLDRPTFGEYQHKQVLQSLDGQSALKVDKIPANLLAGGKVGGKLYAVAGGQTAQMVAYDPDAFAKAGVTVPANGWTWQEFQADMQKVFAATGQPGTTDFGWAIDWFDSWLHQNGKALYTADGKLGFTAADLEQFWNLTGQMREQHEVSAPQATTKMDGSTQNSALVTKQSESEINYDSSLTAYETSYSGKTRAAPLPADRTGADASGMAALPPVYYAVPRTSQHQAAAMELINFLINDPDAGKMLGTSRGLPPNSDIRQQVCASASPNDKSVCDYEQSIADKLGSSQSWLWPSGSSEFKTDFPKAYDNVIFGKTSVADAANQVVHDAQQALGS
jgi:multiple sugar transport system substrate-binding protein